MKIFLPSTVPMLCTLRPALWAALVSVALNCPAAIPAPEKLLPDDTLVVMTVPDMTRMRELYNASPQTQCWKDPVLKPFKDKFMSKLQEDLVGPLERDLGMQLDDFANLPQGQVTFGLIQNGWQGAGTEAPGLVLLLDARDRSSQLKTNLAGLRRKWVDSGKTIKTETIRGIEFSVLPLSGQDMPTSLKKMFPSADDSDDETNKAPKSELVFGQFESLLVVGNSTKAVDKVAAHLTGGSSPSLGDVPSFQANSLALFHDAPCYGWVNVKWFMDLVNRRMDERQSGAQNPFTMFNPTKVLAALGLNGLKTIAFSVQYSGEGAAVQFFVGVPESARQGLFSLFPGSGRESGPPPFVPADAAKFSRLRLDGQKAWAVLEKLVNDLQPGGIDMLLATANAAGKEKDPNFDFKKDLIGNLGDDMITYQKAPRTTASGLPTTPSILLLGSAHADRLLAAMKILSGVMSPQSGPPEREFLGRKIYSMTAPSFVPTANTGKGSPTVSYTASGGYIAMTTDAAMLEEFLRSSDSPQKALRETSGLNDAIARIGGSSTGWLGYENQAETMRVALDILRKSAATGDSPAMLAPGIPAFTPENPLKEWFDFSLLPPYEKVAKYFYFTVYAGSASADGLMFKMFSPVPPQLRK